MQVHIKACYNTLQNSVLNTMSKANDEKIRKQ